MWNFTFSFEEQSVFEKLVTLLEPFQKVTESVSSESKLILYKIMPILLAIEKAIAVRDDDCWDIATVKNKMGQEIEKRTQDTDLAILACTLNPFIKHLRFLEAEHRTRATEFSWNKQP